MHRKSKPNHFFHFHPFQVGRFTNKKIHFTDALIDSDLIDATVCWRKTRINYSDIPDNCLKLNLSDDEHSKEGSRA